MAVVERVDEQEAVGRVERVLAFAASPWALVAILAVTLIAYAPALPGWFLSDDYWFLLGAQESALLDYTIDSFDPRQVDATNEFNRYRPLYPVLWRWQYEIFGMNAWAYHAVVVAAHLGCCALVWLIARRLMRPDWSASLATLIFAIHPVNASPVLWISGNRVFSTLPALAMLLLFMKYLDGGRYRALALSGALACYVAAVLLHSSTVIMLPVLVAYGFFVVGEPRQALQPRRWLPYAPFVAVAVGVVLTQMYVRDRLEFDGTFDFGFHQYSTVARYLGMLVVGLEAGELSGGLERVAGLARGAAALLVIAAVVVIVSSRPVQRVTLFAAFWAFLAMLPDSTFIFTVAGRVLYLAAAPFAMFVVLAGIWIVERARAADLDLRGPALAMCGVLVFGSLALTMYRVEDRRRTSRAEERFAVALRDTGPEVPEGGVLFVGNAPRSLTDLTPTWMFSLAQLYYPGHEIREYQIGSQPGPDDRVFRYEP